MKTALKALLCCIAPLFFNQSVKSQTGNNEIQVSGQIPYPIGDLATIVKRGYGYSAKGLWGVGKAKQQITAESGNNFFDIKEKYLTNKIEASYSSWPIYGGYRRYAGGFYAEGQVGFAVNTINAFRDDTFDDNFQTKTYFAWALGAGYKIKYFELGSRFQTSLVANSADITFISFHLSVRIPFLYAGEIKKL
ncbi:hypothetical protein IDJ77_02320 [Mucilaginibacter sp. ZT4R22]|uniref:Outer membrane protein with beta-barrel domain n=1 Tax=Mucilaginibacter pankratovii TaxID=2772110 RepID=A0ABR7WJY6_9SPHI|nr:hypothetical protein [Mucilaginibacter pankratovii]MBD1362633.1 hypothetical protein [Mucilaginibacter pankratovii]